MPAVRTAPRTTSTGDEIATPTDDDRRRDQESRNPADDDDRARPPRGPGNDIRQVGGEVRQFGVEIGILLDEMLFDLA